MAVSGIFGKRNLSSVDVDLQFPHEMYANRTFVVRVALKNNRAFLPVFLMRVRVGTGNVLFALVDTGEEAFAYLPFSFSRRGVHEVNDCYLESRFPFNFFVRSRRLQKPQEILVFPEPVECDLAYLRSEERGDNEDSLTRQRGEGPDLVGIREYRQGDPLKFVNWKASAKTNALKTTLFSAFAEQPVFIDFDRVGIAHLERKISCVTFVVLRLLKGHTPVGFRLGDRTFRPGLSDAHRFSIMKELALHEQGR